jgi:hypothetical protein
MYTVLFDRRRFAMQYMALGNNIDTKVVEAYSSYLEILCGSREGRRR